MTYITKSPPGMLIDGLLTPPFFTRIRPYLIKLVTAKNMGAILIVKTFLRGALKG